MSVGPPPNPPGVVVSVVPPVVVLVVEALVVVVAVVVVAVVLVTRLVVVARLVVARLVVGSVVATVDTSPVVVELSSVSSPEPQAPSTSRPVRTAAINRFFVPMNTPMQPVVNASPATMST